MIISIQKVEEGRPQYEHDIGWSKSERRNYLFLALSEEPKELFSILESNTRKKDFFIFSTTPCPKRHVILFFFAETCVEHWANGQNRPGGGDGREVLGEREVL